MRISDWSADVCSSDLDGPSRSFARATTDGDRHMLLQRTGYAVTLMTNTGLKHDGKNPAGAPYTLYSHNVRIDERLFDLWANARGFTCRNGSHVPGLLYHHALAELDRKSTRLNSSH